MTRDSRSGVSALVVMNINTMTFAARDFPARRGASDSISRRIWKGEQRSLAGAVALRCGFGLWRRCSSVTDPLRSMCPPRASPQAKLAQRTHRI
jgi:hypothetical protein